MGSSVSVAKPQNSKSNNGASGRHAGGRQGFPQFRNPPMFDVVFGVADIGLRNCVNRCMFTHATNGMIEGRLECTSFRRICYRGFVRQAVTTTTTCHVCSFWTTRLRPRCIPFRSVANCRPQRRYFGSIQKGIPAPISCLSPSTFASFMCMCDVIDDCEVAPNKCIPILTLCASFGSVQGGCAHRQDGHAWWPKCSTTCWHLQVEMGLSPHWYWKRSPNPTTRALWS